MRRLIHGQILFGTNVTRVHLLYGSSRMQRISWTMSLTSFTPINGSDTAGRPTSAQVRLRTLTSLTPLLSSLPVIVPASVTQLNYILQKQFKTRREKIHSNIEETSSLCAGPAAGQHL